MAILTLSILLLLTISRTGSGFTIPDECEAFFTHCMPLLMPGSGSVLMAAIEPLEVVNEPVDCSGTGKTAACLSVQTESCPLWNTTALGDLQNDFCRQETDFSNFMGCWSSDEFRDARIPCQMNNCVSNAMTCVTNGLIDIPANICPEEAKTMYLDFFERAMNIMPAGPNC